MPKAARRKWYAVRKGWDGPRIYNTWEETQKGVWRYPGAVFKSFRSQSAAEEWLQIGIEAMGDNTPLVNHASPVNTSSLPRANSIPMIMDADSSTEPEKTFSSPPGNDSTSPGASGSNMDVSEDASEKLPLEPLEPAVKLSPEQEHVFNLVKSGKSVFFTGSAGTGKSVLLRAIIRWCQKEHKNYAVTASTGIASVNIGGTTLHSWAGIGQGKETAEKLVGKIIGHDKWLAMKERQKRIEQGLSPDDPGSFIDDKSSPRTLKRWRMCDVLILDEISMIDGKLFDKLEFMARALRQNPKPFGGIQLVLSGDFCQLPPVPDKEKNVVIPATFAFDAKSWNACVGKPIALTKVFRQKDQHFVDMLNAMRFGNLNQHYIQAFRGLNRKVEYADGLEPTDLFPTRHEVDNANSHRLNAIQAEPHQYEARDTPGYDSNGNLISKDQMNRLLDRLVAPQSITLKVGAQVMLIKNIVQGVLVNGSLGRVIDFLTTREASAQGLKLSIIDNEKERVWQGEEEARRRGFQRHKRIPNELMNSSVKWPVVQFATSLGGSMELPMCCIPCSFDVNSAEGRIEAMREQVPLILAWALSIHKSQGQTLQRVRVDLSRIFEKGQAYVALSRATNMDTLEVRGFDPLKVQAHPRVIAWTREHTDTHIPYGASQSGYDSSDEAEYWDHV